MPIARVGGPVASHGSAGGGQLEPPGGNNMIDGDDNDMVDGDSNNMVFE